MSSREYFSFVFYCENGNQTLDFGRGFNWANLLTFQQNFERAFFLVSSRIRRSVCNDGCFVKGKRWLDPRW